MIRILVTGSKGFVGTNLCKRLDHIDGVVYTGADVDTPPEQLDKELSNCDFVVHLAGVNRPKSDEQFRIGNTELTQRLINRLSMRQDPPPVLLASSTQAALDNPYGKSKREAEENVFDYSDKTGARVCVYRFPGIFGKWCRPDYNSVVATFCHNIANGLPITIYDREKEIALCYIDDVVDEMISAVFNKEHRASNGYCFVEKIYKTKLGELADTIKSFDRSRKDLVLSDVTKGSLSQRLWATYLSYLPPENSFAYPLTTHSDNRGSFTEIIRTISNGQFSVNVSRPGITKGDHWHDTKFEKFIVVSGKAEISFRDVRKETIHRYRVDARNGFTVVDIPPGYTHSIKNLGDTDLVTLMWASECYDPEHPDTFTLKTETEVTNG